MTKDELTERLRHAGTPEERHALLEEYRQYILANTTPKERKEQMDEFIEKLNEVGRKHFPHATEEEAYGNDCPNGKCEM
jgi:hypothetical protein